MFVIEPDLRKGHYISDAYARVYGGDPQRFRDSPAVLAEIVHPDDLGVATDLMLSLREDAQAAPLSTAIQRAEIRLVDRERRLVWNEFIGSAFDVGDGSRRIVGVAYDDTRRHQSDALIDRLSAASAESLRATADFMSRFSHELRTPLHAMLGYAQLLEMGAGDPQDFLPRLRRAGNHVVQLLDDLLDFSRLTAGRLALDIEPVPVARSIDDAIELAAPLAQEHGTILERVAADRVAVLGDAVRLRQVLTNIITNAIKYQRVPDGRVTVRVAADASSVRISVTDTGPGIAADELDRVFVAFDRMSAEGSSVSGAGLGLPLSRGFVRAMHGDITVESDLGVGSTFTVTLPRAADASDDRVSGPSRPRFSILCVDGDAEARRILTTVLARVPGAHTYCVAAGADGIAYLERQPPDLVVLDRHLPDMAGDEVVRQIARAAPGCPVILISSDVTVLDASITSPPVVATLAKPLDLDQFMQTVHAVLPPPRR
jgi:signal transduction histidine kinase/CheY-like chemotaxis protein